MRAIVPLKRWHLAWLEDAGAAPGMSALPYTAETLRVLEASPSWTAVIDGSPIACGGLLPQWGGRYVAWVFLIPQAGKHMRFVTRAAVERLAKTTGRIEMTVRRDFPSGQRWAEMLGFEIENPPGILKAYGPEGEDHIAYVRFNKEA